MDPLDFKRNLELNAIKEDIDRPPSDEPITDTSKLGPANILLGTMKSMEETGSHEGFITGMEAAGQREVVKASDAGKTRLPADGILSDRMYGGEGNGKTTRQILKSYGLTIADSPIETDDIWVEVSLPEGWSVKPTDHAMWNELRDNKGKKRGMFFYKAAFYDRSCHFHLERRFSTGDENTLKDSYEGTEPHYGIVLDGATEIQKLGPFKSLPKPEGRAEFDSKNPWRARDIARKAAETWLNENRPDWNSYDAYWDVP